MDLQEVYNKTLIMERNGVDIAFRAGICLMFQSGVRISSILQIHSGDISKDGRIMLKQGKGSSPMVVMPVYYREYFLECRNIMYSPFLYHNYMYYYRLCKNYSLCGDYDFGSKKAVTATARKEVANDMFGTNDKIVSSAVALGHKRLSSTEYYIKKGGVLKQSKKGILGNPVGIVENLVVCKNGVIRVKGSI